jgi:predicted mannosyl-3-phosphoglycerate phosphatase (HAD superfamily)
VRHIERQKAGLAAGSGLNDQDLVKAVDTAARLQQLDVLRVRLHRHDEARWLNEGR